MKCPYCKTEGARLHAHAHSLASGASIHPSISCVNPRCTAYDPILYGPHPDMAAEKIEKFNNYLKVIGSEADFDIVTPSWRRKIRSTE